jgi:hypothetical protein
MTTVRAARYCTVEDCERPFRARGYCTLHYLRFMTTGDPLRTPRFETERLFWERVEKTETCWLWKGSCTSEGYGQIQMGRRFKLAHRYAYELLCGPIPDGKVLDHLCRVTACVNPDHLEAVTDRINSLRGISPSAKNAQKTACVNGHPFTAENTYTYGGHRVCKTCSRIRVARYRQKERQT